MSGSPWTPYTIVDPSNQGMPIATFGHPADWRADSRVIWNLQNTQLPVQVFAFTGSQDRSHFLEFLPLDMFVWPPPPFVARGQNAAGATALEPFEPVDAITKIIVPKYRGNFSDLRIVSAEATQEKPPFNARIPDAKTRAARIKVRIAFTADGSQREEEIRALQTVVEMPSLAWGMPPMTSWNLSELHIYSARAGELDSVLPVFEHIAGTWQENPQWKTLVQQTVQRLLAQANQAANQTNQNGWDMVRRNGEASQQFMQRNQAYVDAQQRRIDAMPNPVYTQTSTVFSSGGTADGGSEYTSHNQTIDGIREEQTVNNPANSANDKFNSHYDHVWKDQDGNLWGTDDPSADPNFGSDHRQWTRAPARRPGGS